ncbi:hypothetical protein HDV00_005841 [Rhizophlyctis rosea]|nr:hypothetical protein HDV00_005841 [Rhizophlyctis rosea]
MQIVHDGGTLTDDQYAEGARDLELALESYPAIVLVEFRSTTGDTIFASNDTALTDPVLAPLRSSILTASRYTVGIPQKTSKGILWATSSPVFNNNIMVGSIHVIRQPRTLTQITSDTTGFGSQGQLVVVALLNSTHFTPVMPPVTTPSIYGAAIPVNEHPLIEYALRNQSGIMQDNNLLPGISSSPFPVTVGYRPLPFNGAGSPWIIQARMWTAQLDAPIKTLQYQLLAGAAVSLAFALTLSILFTRVLVIPLVTLRDLANRLSKGDLSARSEARPSCFPDEITELTASFDFMADQLATMYGQMEGKVAERTKELEAARKQADAASAAKSAFLATMTHEIRTPLNGIIGLGAILAESPLNADQKDLVASIRECSDGLLIIVNDVLDFSKIEAGKMELEDTPFNISQCIRTALYPLTLRALEKGIYLNHEIQQGTPTMLVGDVTRLKQILINLVGNSIKFTAEGGVTVKVLSRQVVQKRWELRFDITDTGIGIPEDSLHMLFQSFTQVDSTITRRYGGTGLGLAITKKLVQMMGGTIGVESEMGKGSTFYFTLKFDAAEVPAPKADETTADALKDFAILYPMKILMAEDNMVNQKLAIRMMSKLGYQMDIANNGEEAYNMVKAENSYELVFMDMQMPIMGGIEATEKIRHDPEITKQPFIIALTANAMDTDRQKCIAAGMNAHVSKPVKMDILVETMKSFGIRLQTERFINQVGVNY